MSSESELLYDLIKHCPNNSTWEITRDSCERLPELLKGFMTISEIDIQVIVNDHSRDKLLEVIERNDLNEKIVHQSIIDSSGKHIMNSWDHMVLCQVSHGFPKVEDLILKYGNMDYFTVIE